MKVATESLGYWKPLENLAWCSAVGGKVLPALDPDAFMFMGIFDQHGKRIYVYKRIDNRKHLNLDSSCRAYEFVPGAGYYTPISIARAINALSI